MAVRKLESTDGFVVVDFPDAPAAGPIRRARKILESSATDLARSASYTFASYEDGAQWRVRRIECRGRSDPGCDRCDGRRAGTRRQAGRLHLFPARGSTPTSWPHC